MKLFLALVFICIFKLFPHQNISVSTYDNEIYVCNGFSRKIYVYNTKNELRNVKSTDNIYRNANFDYFTRSDRFRSYLSDSRSALIFLLDENYRLIKSLNIKKKFNMDFYRKIYPSEYNSLIISSDDKENIFILKSAKMRKIISLDSEYKDVFADAEKIYILNKDSISVHSHQGYFVDTIPVDKDKGYSELYITSSRIFLKNSKQITSFNKDLIQKNTFEADNIISFAAIDSTVFYISEDSLKLKNAEL